MTQRRYSSMFLVQLLAASPLWTCTDVPQPEQQTRGHRHVVPLHRQRVPVRNDNELVSFKSVYFGTITLGTPAVQTFKVVFDTGSGHVIVPSVTCKSLSCQAHNKYNPRLSSMGTAIDHDGTIVRPGAAHEQITIAFGTGEVTGQFAHDRLCLSTSPRPSDANATADPLKPWSGIKEPGCINMRVVTGIDMSDEPFASFTFDGVLGLGFESLALAPEFSFFGMLVAHGRLAHPSFGVYLADSEDDFSEISFGGHNPERVNSEISWAPVALPELGYWQVEITAVRVGSKTLDFCADGQCRAVVDTGTSLIAVPSALSDTLFDELASSLQDPPSKSGVTDCKLAIGHLLELEIAGITLVLGPGDYARASVQMAESDGEEEEAAAMSMLDGPASKVKLASVPMLDDQAQEAVKSTNVAGSTVDDSAASKVSEATEQNHEAKCFPTLMPIDLPEPVGPKLFILGEPVLKKYYTVYDWSQQRVGFGLAAHNKNTEDHDRMDGTGESMPLLTIV